MELIVKKILAKEIIIFFITLFIALTFYFAIEPITRGLAYFIYDNRIIELNSKIEKTNNKIISYTNDSLAIFYKQELIDNSNSTLKKVKTILLELDRKSHMNDLLTCLTQNDYRTTEQRNRVGFILDHYDFEFVNGIESLIKIKDRLVGNKYQIINAKETIIRFIKSYALFIILISIYPIRYSYYLVKWSVKVLKK